MIASRQGPTATNTPIDSKGEAVSTSLTQQIENTRSSKCISFVFGFGEDSPIEATGLSLDACGRAAVLISAILIGPALLQLASDAAGCNKTNIDDTYSECELKIYGFRPSSLLTNIGAISGAIVAIFLPLFGSIVDHTSYRRQIGLLTAAAITTLKVIQISVGPSTWFAIAILQVIIHLLYNFHITGSYAYISELTTDPTKLSRYNSSFFTTLFIVMVTFLIVVVGISMILGVDDVGTARISQILVTIVCTVSWSIAWLYYFQDRPAASQVPEGMSLLTCGFRKNIDTVRTIVGSNSALALLLLSVAFAEASSAAIITVGTTYMKEVLHMDADEST
jgi:MFS transporter, UMF1 family